MAAPDPLLIDGVRVTMTERIASPSVFKTGLNLRFGAAQALIARLRGIRLLDAQDRPLYQAKQLPDVLYVLMRHHELPENPDDLPELVRAGRAEAAAALEASTTPAGDPRNTNGR